MLRATRAALHRDIAPGSGWRSGHVGHGGDVDIAEGTHHLAVLLHPELMELHHVRPAVAVFPICYSHVLLL